MKKIETTSTSATAEFTQHELVMLCNALADCASAMETGEFECRISGTTEDAENLSDRLHNVVEEIEKKKEAEQIGAR